MRLSVVKAGAQHLDALELLENQCFSLPWTRQQLAGCFSDEQHVFLVAEDADSGAVLGYVALSYVLDEGNLDNIAVAPAYRRQGVAAALIETLLRRARELSLACVMLEVRQSNAPAIALYESFGFAPVGKRKGYYEKPREDAVLMTLFLK